MIRPSSEWRTVFHFDLAAVPATWSTIVLAVPLHGLDAGAPDGDLALCVFEGDGVVSLDEFDCSIAPETTFAAVGGEYPVPTYDVTTLVGTYIGLGYTHIAFRVQLSGGNTDRFDLGATGGVPDPTLSVTP